MNLPKVVGRRQKRRGQGGGSGKGFHTAGRGQKGQKSRTKVHVLFEGYKVKKSLLHRLPVQRGRGRFKKQSVKPLIVDFEMLNILPDKSEVTIETLVKNGIVNDKDARLYGVKVLGNGKLTKKLTINLPISKSAEQKVKQSSK